MLLTILIITAIALILIVGSLIAASHHTGIVPMPSLPFERRLVSLLIHDYPAVSRVIDLGSGWGGLARNVARSNPNIEVTAIEKSAVPHLYSVLLSRILRLKTIRCSRENLHTMKLSDNEGYITYLSGPAMKKLRLLFERDQPRGGFLISIAFSMPGWTPSRIKYAEGPIHTPVYIYEL